MRKIMFNDKYELTRAVLEGKKTMTRRIVPQGFLGKVRKYQEKYYAETLDHISAEDAIINMIGPERLFCNSFKIGEVVAVTQSYRQIEKEIEKEGYPLDLKREKRICAGYTNKMFVRAEDMPHHIKITNMRVEHLQDISDEDCLREGVFEKKLKYTPSGYTPNRMYYTFDGIGYCFNDARDAFAVLINKISGKGTWENNPLVWVYEFELVD